MAHGLDVVTSSAPACGVWPGASDGLLGPRVEDDPTGRIWKRGYRSVSYVRMARIMRSDMTPRCDPAARRAINLASLVSVARIGKMETAVPSRGSTGEPFSLEPLVGRF